MSTRWSPSLFLCLCSDDLQVVLGWIVLSLRVEELKDNILLFSLRSMYSFPTALRNSSDTLLTESIWYKNDPWWWGREKRVGEGWGSEQLRWRVWWGRGEVKVGQTSEMFLNGKSSLYQGYFLQLFLSFPAGKAGIPIWIQVNLIILYIRTEQREVHVNIPKSFVGSVSIEWEIN